MGNFPRSLEAGLKALQISEQHHFVAEEQLSLIRIANVYSSSKDFTAALNYYRAAEKKLKLAPDGYLIAAVQVFIGDIYEELNQFDSSLYYERQASHKVFLYPSILPIYFRVLGNIETKSGNNQLALKYFDQGLQAALLEYDYRKAASVYISMASLYNALNQIDSAIYNANLALVYGQKLAYKSQIMEAGYLVGRVV
jgi:tetratricopeptide (TPR) repeat protein